jgi:hypothetical protein
MNHRAVYSVSVAHRAASTHGLGSGPQTVRCLRPSAACCPGPDGRSSWSRPRCGLDGTVTWWAAQDLSSAGRPPGCHWTTTGRIRRFLGQAVTDGLLLWRGRGLREAPFALVVDPGLRPRFFSVFPTPANFRSR